MPGPLLGRAPCCLIRVKRPHSLRILVVAYWRFDCILFVVQYSSCMAVLLYFLVRNASSDDEVKIRVLLYHPQSACLAGSLEKCESSPRWK